MNVDALIRWLGGLDDASFRVVLSITAGLTLGLGGGVLLRALRWSVHGRARLRPPGCPRCAASLLGPSPGTVPERCSECGAGALQRDDPRLRWVERGTPRTTAMVTVPVLLIGGVPLLFGAQAAETRRLIGWRDDGQRLVVLAERTRTGERAQRQRDALTDPSAPLPTIEDFCAVRDELQAWSHALPGDVQWIRGLLDGTQAMPDADRHPYVLEMLASAVRLEALTDAERAAVIARCPPNVSFLPPSDAVSGQPLRWAARVALPRAVHAGLIASAIAIDGVPLPNATPTVVSMGPEWIGEAIPIELAPGRHRIGATLSLVTRSAGPSQLLWSTTIEAPLDVRAADVPPSPSTWHPFVGRDRFDQPAVTAFRTALPGAARDLCLMHLEARFGSTVTGVVDHRTTHGWRPIARLRPRTSFESLAWIEDRASDASDWGDELTFRIRPETPDDASLPRAAGRTQPFGGEDWTGEVTLTLRRSNADLWPHLRRWDLVVDGP